MAKISRRESLKLLAAAPMTAGFSWTNGEVQKAHENASRAVQQPSLEGYSRQFFTEHEYRTVEVLVDLIIPADDRSGSATEAGVPQFMDFIMVDEPRRQTAMRGGLAWIDYFSLRQFDKTFLDSFDDERRELLDAIAWPEKAEPALSQGVSFFNSFRDLTATGFWTSQMGIEDLDFRGNRFLTEWTGCPEQALNRLGVEYSDEG